MIGHLARLLCPHLSVEKWTKTRSDSDQFVRWHKRRCRHCGKTTSSSTIRPNLR